MPLSRGGSSVFQINPGVDETELTYPLFQAKRGEVFQAISLSGELDLLRV